MAGPATSRDISFGGRRPSPGRAQVFSDAQASMGRLGELGELGELGDLGELGGGAAESQHTPRARRDGATVVAVVHVGPLPGLEVPARCRRHEVRMAQPRSSLRLKSCYSTILSVQLRRRG